MNNEILDSIYAHLRDNNIHCTLHHNEFSIMQDLKGSYYCHPHKNWISFIDAYYFTFLYLKDTICEMAVRRHIDRSMVQDGSMQYRTINMSWICPCKDCQKLYCTPMMQKRNKKVIRIDMAHPESFDKIITSIRSYDH